MLIVNADDLGYDARTNEAIIRSLELRLCSSTTLLANMEGFEEACELIHERSLGDRVGLHLNLSEGRAVDRGNPALPSLLRSGWAIPPAAPGARDRIGKRGTGGTGRRGAGTDSPT